MSIWIREDGTISDSGDPTAFEYVPVQQRDRLKEALSMAVDELEVLKNEIGCRIATCGVIEDCRAALKECES